MYKPFVREYDEVEWIDDKDYGGRKYGRLTVKHRGRIPRKGKVNYRYVFLCDCDCGNPCIKDMGKVTRGYTQSCGCLHKEVAGIQFRKEKGYSGFNEKYQQYRKSAKKRGYDFQLSKEEFAQVVTQPCIYCGRSNTQVCRKGIRGEFYYTGIDRYDNTKGYIVDNIVPCCARCNRIKTDIPIDELEKHLELIMSRKDMWKRTA